MLVGQHVLLTTTLGPSGDKVSACRARAMESPQCKGGVETVRPYVNEFIQFAKDHPELTFLVTRIGCGIAGFTDAEMAPLFEKAHSIENVILPEGW